MSHRSLSHSNPRSILFKTALFLGTLGWSLNGSPALAQPSQIYLQQTGPESSLVVWDGDGPSSLCYGDSPASLTQHRTGRYTDSHHEVLVTGLSPEQTYYYSVAQASCPPSAPGDGGDYFRTAPVAGSARPVRLWVVGDSGTGGSAQRRVLSAMENFAAGHLPDVFLHLGDMAYSSGTVSEFDARFFAMYERVLRHTPIWPTLGNHEGRSSDSGSQSGPYYDAFVLPTGAEIGGLPSGTEAYYSFDYANIHVVVLDSHDSSRRPADAMLSWLSDDLAASDQDWLIAFFHHPPYTHGSHDSDREGQLIEMRENALPILEAAGVDLVLAGHSHIYERSFLLHGAYDTPTTRAGHIVDPGDGRIAGDGAYSAEGDGAVYVVAGHGGTGVSGPADHPVMYFSEVENGSCIVDVDGPLLSLVNIRADGEQTDELQLLRSTGLAVTHPRAGQVFLAGQEIHVDWVSESSSPQVGIDASFDGGTTWSTIIDTTGNDGNYGWASPARPMTGVIVRVRDLGSAQSAQSGPFALSAQATVQVLASGDGWEYHDGPDAPGMDWHSVMGGWPAGPGQLGFGEGDEATTLQMRVPNTATYYFRHELDMAEVARQLGVSELNVEGARARVLYDDGFALMLNGTQVGGVNVDDGLSHDQYASSSSVDNATTDLELSAALFVPGSNIVAALVKQSSGSSSDVSFDLWLSLDVSVPASALADGGVASADGGMSAPDGGNTSNTDAAFATRDGGEGMAPSDGGCGCRVGGRESKRSALAWFGLMALMALVRSRKGRG